MATFIVPLVIGVGLFLLGFFNYRKAQASQSWPSVSGRIVAARVESETTHGDADSADSTSYYPAIQYEYQVGSALLRGSSIAFDRRGYARQSSADKALLAYQVGASAQVYYNPAKPNDCVLERKASSGLPLMIIGAVIALIVVVAAIAS
ncbi:MAG: DUF3592 domain-containing protein [Acidobacteriota bacterium]